MANNNNDLLEFLGDLVVRLVEQEMAVRLTASMEENRSLKIDLHLKNAEIRVANENVKHLIERVQQLEQEKAELEVKYQKQVQIQDSEKKLEVETNEKEEYPQEQGLESPAVKLEEKETNNGYGKKVKEEEPPTAAQEKSTGTKRRRN